MKRFTMALSVLSVLALAACSSSGNTMWGKDAPKAADTAFSKASHK